MNRGVSTFVSPNRPRTARITRLCGCAVVLALAMCSPDRMDGRKIENVKTHARHVVESFLARPETRHSFTRRAGTRKHLVPRAESRPLAVHPHEKFLIEL